MLTPTLLLCHELLDLFLNRQLPKPLWTTRYANTFFYELLRVLRFRYATDWSVFVSITQDTIFEGAYFLWSFDSGPLQLLRLDSISEGTYSWRESMYDMYVDPDTRHLQFDSDEVRYSGEYDIPVVV